MQIVLTQEHFNFLSKNHIYLSLKPNPPRTWLAPGMKLLIDAKIWVEPYSCFLRAPYFFSMGSHSYSKSSLPGLKIGRYCAVAPGVTIMPSDHPTNRLTTCGLDYAEAVIYDDYLRGQGKYITKVRVPRGKSLPTVGHDVWIGYDVVLGRGVHVGNGAVIAGKSVVTKDVPDYAVVAGVPATVRKYRFPEMITERLVRAKWWEYDLVDFCHLDTTDPVRFLDGFEPLLVEGKIRRYQPQKILLHDVFARISGLV